jgi:hypothetical protein
VFEADAASAGVEFGFSVSVKEARSVNVIKQAIEQVIVLSEQSAIVHEEGEADEKMIES